tara:strand:+ start:296 stop:424 length:129 start_codon:yes stop_codon:yes gene_type:complete
MDTKKIKGIGKSEVKKIVRKIFKGQTPKLLGNRQKSTSEKRN